MRGYLFIAHWWIALNALREQPSKGLRCRLVGIPLIAVLVGLREHGVEELVILPHGMARSPSPLNSYANRMLWNFLTSDESWQEASRAPLTEELGGWVFRSSAEGVRARSISALVSSPLHSGAPVWQSSAFLFSR